MEQGSMDNRIHTMALLAVLDGGERARDLCAFLNDDERPTGEAAVERFLEVHEESGEVLRTRLTGLVSSESFSGIAEIHPAWIMEAIKDEQPRIMGVIMRYLPSRHVRYILERLPAEVKDRIPKLIESFAVPQDVLAVIRHQFEARFLPMRISKALSHFGLEHLYYLKGEEVEALCAELGMCEMALALDGMSEKMVRVVLNRLKLKDAKRLHERMVELSKASPELKRQARYAILEIDDDASGPDELLVSIGLSCLSRSLVDLGDGVVERMCQKLDPRVSSVLKRCIADNASSTSPGLIEGRKSLVLSSIARLAAEGRIDSQWARFAPVNHGGSSA
jgi:hypothetical protein